MKRQTTLDPIIAEMHAIKDANAERFGGDLKAFFNYLSKLDPKSLPAKKTTSNLRRPRKAKNTKKVLATSA